MTSTLPNAVRAIVEAFAPRPDVVAIALGGSRTSSHTDPASDYDVYVFVDSGIPVELRRHLAGRFDPEMHHSRDRAV